MKKCFLKFIFLSLFVVSAAYAEETVKNEKETAVKAMYENLSKLKSQEIVVQVLASQYNKELMELRKMEAVFCDFYQLNVESWRKGEYEWDNNVGKFVFKKDQVKKEDKREEKKESKNDQVVTIDTNEFKK